jgi:hypothetical protein
MDLFKITSKNILINRRMTFIHRNPSPFPKIKSRVDSEIPYVLIFSSESEKIIDGVKNDDILKFFEMCLRPFKKDRDYSIEVLR